MQSREGNRRLSKKWVTLAVIITVDLVLSGSLLVINYAASDNKTTNFFFGVEVETTTT
ncbi:hypothetical protein GX563_04625 [Candidatus Bathyarchaeota archaeon]|nr:hypothetical protein [Candidatus Bathyarchaeota archaeon]